MGRITHIYFCPSGRNFHFSVLMLVPISRDFIIIVIVIIIDDDDNVIKIKINVNNTMLTCQDFILISFFPFHSPS